MLSTNRSNTDHGQMKLAFQFTCISRHSLIHLAFSDSENQSKLDASKSERGEDVDAFELSASMDIASTVQELSIWRS